mgnify:CR=1 FL=1
MSKTEMPSIRFGGFDNAWEQRKLGEIITEYKETVDSECTLPILSSSKTEGVILQEEHFGRKQQHDITGYNILPRNYCTYRNRSDGVDFTFNINKCCDKGIISKFYPVFSGKNSDVFFLSLVLNNSDEVVREIAYTCTGTGQKVLSFLDLQKMKVRVPSYDEQKEIAAYFENLDHLITLHQRKYEKLQAFKVSMLEKMFPKDGADVPEVRFKGFDGSWEKMPASELFTSYVDKGHPELPVLSATQDAGMVVRNEIGKSVFHEAANEVGYKRVLPGQFVIHLRSFQGGFAHSAIEGITSPAYTVFGLKEPENHDDYFWKYVFMSKQFIKRLETVTYGIRDGRSISYDEFLTLDFLFPRKEEQSLICQYLLKLDSLIAMRKQELDKLQFIKKALLEKMFV